MKTGPLSLDSFFDLFVRFEPEYWPLLLRCFQHRVAVDETLRGGLDSIGPSLHNPDISPLDLYMLVARHEARLHWQSHLEDLAAPDLSASLEELQGRTLWGIVLLLLDRSRSAAFTDPLYAVALADLAVRLAPRAPLLDRLVPQEARGELHAAALAVQANALRVADRMPQARVAFAEAERVLPQTNFLALRARFCSLGASLEIDDCSYEKALRIIERGFACADRAEDRARLNLKSSIVWLYSRELTAALEQVECAAALLDKSTDPVLTYCVLQHHVEILTRVSRFEEADSRMADLHKRVSILQSESHLLRYRWLEARIATGLGRDAQGEEGLRGVRAAFLASDFPYKAALVTVELAHHLFSHARFNEVATLAAESILEFRRQGIEEEVLAALALLQEATSGHLTLAAIEQLLRRIEALSRYEKRSLYPEQRR